MKVRGGGWRRGAGPEKPEGWARRWGRLWVKHQKGVDQMSHPGHHQVNRALGLQVDSGKQSSLTCCHRECHWHYRCQRYRSGTLFKILLWTMGPFSPQDKAEV